MTVRPPAISPPYARRARLEQARRGGLLRPATSVEARPAEAALPRLPPVLPGRPSAQPQSKTRTPDLPSVVADDAADRTVAPAEGAAALLTFARSRGSKSQ